MDITVFNSKTKQEIAWVSLSLIDEWVALHPSNGVS